MLDLDAGFDFGKHRGKSVLEVLEAEPTYLLFLRRPSDNKPQGYPMSRELHMVLDAKLYSDSALSERGKNKPRFSKEEVEIFMADIEGRAERQEARESKVNESRTIAYAGLWGAW